MVSELFRAFQSFLEVFRGFQRFSEVFRGFQRFFKGPLRDPLIGDLKITSTSIERQKRSQNLAPVLVITSGNSLVFSTKMITSTGFYRYCAPDAPAPVVVKNQSPISECYFPLRVAGHVAPNRVAP